MKTAGFQKTNVIARNSNAYVFSNLINFPWCLLGMFEPTLRLFHEEVRAYPCTFPV